MPTGEKRYVLISWVLILRRSEDSPSRKSPVSYTGFRSLIIAKDKIYDDANTFKFFDC